MVIRITTRYRQEGKSREKGTPRRKGNRWVTQWRERENRQEQVRQLVNYRDAKMIYQNEQNRTESKKNLQKSRRKK